jgi:hypothetical protein
MGYLHTYLNRIHQEAHSTRQQKPAHTTTGQAGPTRVRPRPWHRPPELHFGGWFADVRGDAPWGGFSEPTSPLPPKLPSKPI